MWHLLFYSPLNPFGNLSMGMSLLDRGCSSTDPGLVSLGEAFLTYMWFSQLSVRTCIPQSSSCAKEGSAVG